jgi:hypothetical protein
MYKEHGSSGPNEYALPPEGYDGSAFSVDEQKVDTLIKVGRVTIENKGGIASSVGDIVKLNDTVYARVVYVESEGNLDKIDLELLNQKPNFPGPEESTPYPEGYRGLSFWADEEQLSTLTQTGRVTVINKMGILSTVGDIMKLNDTVYAKVVNIEGDGAAEKIDLELLGD